MTKRNKTTQQITSTWGGEASPEGRGIDKGKSMQDP